MSENETFLEEDAFAPAEQFGEGNSVIGGDSTVPDETILGDLRDLAGLTFGTRWSQSESVPRSDREFPKRRPMRRCSDSGREFRGSVDGRSDSDRVQSGGSGREFRGSVDGRSDSDRVQSGAGREFRGSVDGRSDSDRVQPAGFGREFREGEGRPPRERRSRRFEDRKRENRVILPPFEVQFYQEDASFNLLLDEMRKNCKTYELFAVARLILQKPERFVVAVRRRPDREGVRLPLYLSLLDDWVFSSEHEAMAYILQHHIEEFFDVAEETVEAPKGRFTCVHRCGITKKLLSAPNYHKYRTILRTHFESEIHSIPFERFIAKIETTKEESDIQNWILQMSRKVTYTPKVIDEAVTDLVPRDSLDGAKNYLLQYFKDRILREVTSIRIAGTAFESVPTRAIVHAIQFFLQRQRNFPFDTASNLRYGFRRAGFSMYRKGKGGISYICATRRKFRTVGDVFEAGVQALIDFLESHETIPLATLQRDYIEANHLPEKEVLGGLDWLIREGYVVHYDNGTLFLNPKSFPRTDKVGESAKVKSESIIPLGKIETAVEKLSDGTLLLNPESASSSDGADESAEIKSESIISLGKMGTAVEKLSDGTLLLNPESASSSDGADESAEIKSESIISLGKIETAVEKLSDGTLSIAQTTVLAAPNDNLGIGPLARGSDAGDEVKNEVDELENKTTNEKDQNILDH